MNFKVFVEAAIQELMIKLMTFAWLRHRNKNIFLCLNPECFCLFDMNFKIFVLMHHVDASCVDDVIKTRKFLFIWMLIASFYLINFCWPEFLCFCGGKHVIYKPTITRMLNVFRIGIFLFVWMLIDSVYFINCHKHEIQGFLWERYQMSLQWGWCLLRNDVIKIGSFIFVWTLIVSI